jgi:hypothetical protein
MTATASTSDELARVGEAEELTVQPMVTAEARATTLRLVPRP